MITVTLEDQQGGIAVVLRDANAAPYYPDATVGAARVQVWARNKDKGVDSAIRVEEYRPGGDVDFNVGALGSRDLLIATVSVSATGTPSVSDLNHADWRELNFAPDTADALAADDQVPTVTLAPSVSKEAEGLWTVFTPAPDGEASTATTGKLRVRKADALSVEFIYYIPVAGFHHIPQPAFDCVIDYQWRNQSSEDAGQGRGWSAWSPTATANGAANAVQPEPVATVITDPSNVFDAHDSMAANEREMLAL